MDWTAAAWLDEQLDAHGLSPEELSSAIKDMAERGGWAGRGTVDAHTIRRIVKNGHCPQRRVRMNIALYFGTRPELVWVKGRGRVAS